MDGKRKKFPDNYVNIQDIVNKSGQQKTYIFILVHYEYDTAEGHSHDTDPFTRRPGDGVHHPFQGAGKLRDAARCGGNVGEAKAESQKAENGTAGERGFTRGKEVGYAHNDLRGGRHAARRWGL